MNWDLSKVFSSKNKYKTVAAIITIVALLLFWHSVSFPLFKVSYSTVIYSQNEKLLGAHIANDGQWRFPQGDSVPDKFKTCLLMFEDEHFYHHPGVNPFAIIRALKQNISSGEVKSGGSTITMQVIRMATQRNRNLFSKIIEAFQSLRIELIFSKDEILSLYATHAPFGGNVVGLEAAAWRYFHRPAYMLSWAEQATLAVLPNAPGLIHTGKNRKALLLKRNRLLKKLLSKNKIDSTSYFLAIDEPIPEHPYALPQMASHLLDYCRKKKEGEIYKLSINASLQQQLNSVLKFHYEKLRLNEIHNACAIVVDVQLKKVLAYFGNVNGQKVPQKHVDIIQAPRSTGSILKPFLYAAALQDGQILPKMLIPDIPTFYENFAPKNYSRTYNGAVPADEALSRSLNVPAVKMLEEYDVGRFCDLLQKMGLKTIKSDPDYYGLSLILGGAEATLFDLAGAYTSMAGVLNNYTSNNSTYYNNEFSAPSIFSATSVNRGSLSEYPQVYNAGAIYHTFEALTNVVRPYEESGWQTFSSSKKIAWKTGTSFGYRDAWAIGVTPEYVVGVWVGNATGEGRPGIIGGVTAGPIMFDIFHHLPQTTWFKPPYDDMEKIAVCKKSGYRAGLYCETDSAYVSLNKQKVEICPYHQLIHMNKEQTKRVNSACYPISQMVHKSWFVLPPVMEWYYKRNHPLYQKLPEVDHNCGGVKEVTMQFIYPQNNNRVYLPKGLDGKIQPVVLKVAHRSSTSTIYWHIDDEYLGETSFIHHMEIKPKEGKHYLTLIDEQGNVLNKWIECIGRGD